MPDITMCQGGKCHLKKSCHRFLVKPSVRQSYFAVIPYDGERCEHFMQSDIEIEAPWDAPHTSQQEETDGR